MPTEFIGLIMAALGGLARAVLGSERTIRDLTLSTFFGLASIGMITLWYSTNPIEGFLIGFAGSELLQRTVRIAQALSDKKATPNTRRRIR